MELPRLEDVELTLEDVLNIHRYWITCLYLEDRKTASEIVEILHEHGLKATLSQVRTVIQNWRLILPDIPPESPKSSVPNDSQPTRDVAISTPKSESASIRSDTSSSGNISYPPSDPDVAVLYTFKPLRPLPDVKHNDSKVRKQRSPVTDRIRLTCHHGPLPGDVHEVQTRLDSIPRAGTGLGQSMLEMYTGLQQSHERVAVGLQRNFETHVGYRRAGDFREEGILSKPRVRKGVHVFKRKVVAGRDAESKKPGKVRDKEIEREKGIEDELADEGMDSS